MSSAEAFSGSRVIATDGMIGRVVDLLFDEEKWHVRYLIIKTGDWLPRSQVLISPRAVRFVDNRSRLIVAGLTRHQVAGSPRMDTRTRITRQQEWDYCAHFGYSAYWPCGTYPPLGVTEDEKADRRRRALDPVEEAPSPMRAAVDAGLHSCRAINGFLVRGAAEQLGRVEDVLFDQKTWVIRHLLIAAGGWLEGRRFEVAPERVRSLRWNDRCLVLSVGRADIHCIRDRPQTATRGS